MRRRDLAGGEVAALTGGHNRLTRALWYPPQAGDQLAITMEASETLPQWSGVCKVTEDGRALWLVDSDAPEGIGGGWYAGTPEFLDSRTDFPGPVKRQGVPGEGARPPARAPGKPVPRPPRCFARH